LVLTGGSNILTVHRGKRSVLQREAESLYYARLDSARFLSAALVALFASACTAEMTGVPAGAGTGARAGTGMSGTGNVSGTGQGNGGTGPAGTSGTGGSAGVPTSVDGNLPYTAPSPAAPELRARTWKLSHAEYARAVQALLGVTVDVSDLEPEIDNGVYPNMSASGLVRVTLAGGYYTKAEQITTALTSAELAQFVGGGALNAAAKPAFLKAAIEKAFRRPATADDTTAYGEVFDLGAATTTDGTGGFRAVLRALVTSPYFLYRTEIGAAAAASTFTLTDYEVASLLSFSLLGGPPSSELLAAASRGELTNQATLGAHVGSLVGTSEATAQLARFMSEWLKIHHFDQIDKDATVFPGFEAIRMDMLAEANQFLSANAGPTGTVLGLLTTPVVPTGALATFYASDPSSGGSVGTRTGVLGLGAVVSLRAKPNSTSPTLRGLFVRERFMCQAIHLPADQPPDITETQVRSNPRTTRELYELHAAQESCAGCHALLDPVGFNFEDLDAAGRFRITENGYPVDTTGVFVDSDVNGMMADHNALSSSLSRSEWVRECLAIQAFRFYFGQVEASRGVPPVQAARLAFGSGTLRDAIVATMSSPSTLLRVRN
jgi:hypothetical protein